MNKEEIEKIVDDFLGDQPTTFSQVWRDDLVERIAALEVEIPDQFIDKIHGEKLFEIRRISARWLRKKYNNYSPDKIEDIVDIGFLKWLEYFNAKKSLRSSNPELNYLLWCVKTAQADDYNRDNPILNEELMLDNSGDFIIDESVETRKENKRAVTVSESDVATELQSKELSYELSYGISQLVEIGGKYFTPLTAEGIFKAYLLCGLTKTPSIIRKNTLPEVELAHKPIRKFVTDAVKDELMHVTPPTIYNTKRLHYLKHADSRRWMELAISEMRKSKEKIILYIEQKEKQNRGWGRETADDFKRKTPILSSVAIDAAGGLVAKCYKGQVDEKRNGRDITWDKHCEYSLFRDVIQEDNMQSLEGGTIYVTLEPCNKRGYYYDGEAGHDKPKIPCAVRCVEAGIKDIYIGALDFNPSVFEKGKAILETGTYIFELEKGKHKGPPKDAKASTLLEQYFREKGYKFIEYKDKRVCKIGSPVTVYRFDDDLIEEVCELNAWFLHRYRADAFR